MYQLRPPAAALAPYIEHYWFVSGSEQEPLDLSVNVFVDGRADLIMNLGVPYVREQIGGSSVEIGTSNLDAQRLYPIRIVQRGAVHTVGVRFRLGGLAPFARAPLRPLTGRTVELPEAFGEPGAALEANLVAAKTVAAQAEVFDAFFLSLLTPGAAHATFAGALAEVVAAGGSGSVAELAASASVSVRQLERLFARFLGIPPKTTARVVRFQRALKALMREPDGTLADVAADAGYFDQAHFVRDFRAMTGGVPRGYRGYYPPDLPTDFAPNVVVFVQDAET